jgi:chromate reductase, NAD(P)H dehydrogenase (quinone)
MEWLVVSATSRVGSKSLQLANWYQQQLSKKNISSEILSLENIPLEVFDINNDSAALQKIEKEKIIPAKKFIFVLAEYNGSFPGAIKLLMDCCDIKNCFWYKKAALVGLSDGRNGNLRGLDHFASVLNYLKINVLHYKVNLPQIGALINENNMITDAHIEQTLLKQIEEFEKF